MKGFDLGKFKKSSETLHHATLIHPDGHQIKIAKASLSPKMKGDLANLPMHFDEGGGPDYSANASTVTDTAPMQDSPEAIQQDASNQPVMPDKSADERSVGDKLANIGWGGGQPSPAEQEIQSQSKQDVTSTPQSDPTNYKSPASTTQPNAMGSMMADQYNHMKSSYDLGEKGINAESASGHEAAQSYEQAARKQQDLTQQLMSDTAAKHEANNADISTALQQIKEGHIDPRRYTSNMSVPGKISAAIGLILGGIGGALTGQENPAMKFLNEQIGRDVEGQKLDMDKNQNMMSYFMHKTGDIDSAARMTHAFYGDMYAEQLKGIAAKSNDPAVNGRAQQALAQYQMQREQNLAPVAQRQAVMGNNDLRPEDKINVMFQDPKEKAEAFKELKTSQDMTENAKNAIATWDEINRRNTPLNKLNWQEQRRIDALRDPTLLKMAHDSAGRFNMEEIPYVKKNYSESMDSDSTRALKRKQFVQQVTSKIDSPLLSSRGISITPHFSTPNPVAGYKK